MTTTRPHIVSGERSYLSHFQRSDVPVITHWLSNLETTAYLGMQGRSFLQEQEEDWYTNYTRLDDKNFHFAIVASDTDTIIGTVSLMDIRRPHDRAELGIVIGNTDYWSKGYGREAIRLMCDYGYTFLNLHVIYLWYVSYNQRGRKCYEKSGFVETGRIPEARVFNHQHYDDVVMTMTRTQFGPSQLAGKYGQLPI